MNDFICTLDHPVVQTPKGKIRGYYQNSVYHFRGIRYGTAERFMAPKAVEPWEGVKDALVWGYTAPVPGDFGISDDFTVPHRFWPQSEDCLYLNVWSKKLDASAKKPVMFWIHGGGYFNGSSMEMIAYEGDNLAKFGDVVVVSVNHRLNQLGYFDLSSFGDRYQNSGNRGQEDLVLALQWVQENIAQFGGDPDNVTIFGQSGGGGKVITLLQTPAADGLFHKAVVQSGVGAGLGGEKRVRRDADVAKYMAKILSGDENNIAALESAPLKDLQNAYNEANQALFASRRASMGGPLANDWYVGAPMEVGFTEHAKTVPLMVGTVCAEMGYRGSIPARDDISDEDTLKLLGEEYGEENAQAVFDAFKEAYPDKAPAYALYLSNRLGCIDFCKKFAESASAPVFNYNYAVVFPYNGGVPAWHCAEIPFIFHNAERLSLYQFPGSEAIEETTSRAWVNFAYTGNPSGGAVGNWPALTTEEENTYVFDFHSEARTGYDRKVMELVAKYQKPRFFF